MKRFVRVMLVLCAAFVCVSATGDGDLKKIEDLFKTRKGITWIFTGDSITHGALHTNGYRSFPEIFQERVRWEMRRFNDAVVNTGISGDIVSGILKNYDERIGRFKPDVVFVKIGMNDCGRVKLEDFTNDLTTLVKKIRDDGKAIPILQTTNTVQKGDKHEAKLKPFIEAVRAVADSEKTLLVDNYAKWEKEAKNNWFNDAIHPNERGHIEIAREIMRVLKIDKNAGCLNTKFADK